MIKYYYGMRIGSFDYESLLPVEQKHFIAEQDGAKFSTVPFVQADTFAPIDTQLDLGDYSSKSDNGNDTAAFGGFGGGDSGGGGAQGDY